MPSFLIKLSNKGACSEFQRPFTKIHGYFTFVIRDRSRYIEKMSFVRTVIASVIISNFRLPFSRGSSCGPLLLKDMRFLYIFRHFLDGSFGPTVEEILPIHRQ